MTATVVAIFLIVYLGMVLGGLPFLQLDRTGIALLGAMALIGTGAVTLDGAVRAVDLPTLILLFSFMVVSAQMRLGGFYDWVTQRIAVASLSPPGLLGLLIAVTALLSAIFSNDIVCLAVAPVLIDICAQRRMAPLPFLLALACAANIGSAATLIGNPQNMLIGQTLHLSFGGYLRSAIVPVLLGLATCWGWIVWQTGGRWHTPATPAAAPAHPAGTSPLNAWQTGKGLVVVVTLLVLFLFAPWPREQLAMIGAGLLLTSRRLHSRHMLGQVDWQLLLLFMSLFVVNHAFQQTGIPQHLVARLATAGIRLDHLGPLFCATLGLSNLVSNVPAVMLLLPVAHHGAAGPLLALVSTFSGNLLVVGSIANLIVVDAAARRNIRIDWHSHARIGVPVTLATLGIAAVCLMLQARLA